MVEFFLSEYAQINTRDRVYRYTPLMWAVVENQVDILELLIQRGADLMATDDRCHRTALHWAAAVGHYAAAHLLLKAEKKLVHTRDYRGMTPLAVAYKEGRDWETARLCIKFGSDVNFKFSDGPSLLECASMSEQDAGFANLLIRHGAG
jgi:ankyrin repeat protein